MGSRALPSRRQPTVARWLGLTMLALLAATDDVRAAGYDRPPRLEELTDRQREMMKQIEELAVPLEEEKVFWHYGKPAPCEAMLEAGTYTGRIHEKYSRLSERSGTIAGHGVYVSGNAHSSATYYSGAGIEVVLEKGSRVLDMTNSEIYGRLYRLGITPSDVYNLPLDLTVRFADSDDWYVVKGSTGVTFQPFDISRIAGEPKHFATTFARAPSGLRKELAAYMKHHPVSTDLLVEIALQSDDLAMGEMNAPDVGRAYRALLERDLSPKKLVRMYGALHGGTAFRKKAPEAADAVLFPLLQSRDSGLASLQKVNRVLFAALDPSTNEAKLAAAVNTLSEAERIELENRAMAAFLHLREESTYKLPTAHDEALARVGTLLRDPSLRHPASLGSEGDDLLLTAYRVSAERRGMKGASTAEFPRVATNPATALCKVGLQESLRFLRGPAGILGPAALGLAFPVGLQLWAHDIYTRNREHVGRACTENGGSWTPIEDVGRRVYGDCFCPLAREANRIHTGNSEDPLIACGATPEASGED